MRALLGLALLIAPLTAMAADHRFVAEFAAAPAKARFVSGGMGWSCTGANCTAVGDMSDSAGRLCARLAMDAGRVSSFAVGATALDSTALEKCNARARPAAEPALARN